MKCKYKSIIVERQKVVCGSPEKKRGEPKRACKKWRLPQVYQKKMFSIYLQSTLTQLCLVNNLKV